MILIEKKCKICRREGKKLFLKGEKCYSAKCPFIKRQYPPGIHGPKGYPKLSGYGKQLREKQKLKRIFGISERQLKIYYKKASKTKGNTEENLLRILEQRLDNVIYRARFAISRSQARQFVTHGHIKVRGRRVDIPSFQVKEGDEITLKPTSKIVKKIKENISINKRLEIEVPSWLSVDEEKLVIKVLRKPSTDNFIKDINIKSVIEFYG